MPQSSDPKQHKARVDLAGHMLGGRIPAGTVRDMQHTTIAIQAQVQRTVYSSQALRSRLVTESAKQSKLAPPCFKLFRNAVAHPKFAGSDFESSSDPTVRGGLQEPSEAIRISSIAGSVWPLGPRSRLLPRCLPGTLWLGSAQYVV